MPLMIAISAAHLPGGATVAVEQTEIQRGDRDDFFYRLAVKRIGPSPATKRGTIRFTREALARIPGQNDRGKSRHVSEALAEWLSRHMPQDGFSLEGSVFNDRVEFELE